MSGLKREGVLSYPGLGLGHRMPEAGVQGLEQLNRKATTRSCGDVVVVRMVVHLAVPHYNADPSNI